MKHTMGRTAIPQRSRLDLRGKVSFQMLGSLTKEGRSRGARGELEGRSRGDRGEIEGRSRGDSWASALPSISPGK